MKSKVLGLAAVWLVASVMSGSAAAAAVTFQFDMPNWTSSNSLTIFGTRGILTVTVDNGSAGAASQTYLNNQITSARVTAVGGTFDHTWDGSTGSGSGLLSYISTDAAGVPTLDLLTKSSASTYRFDDTMYGMGLGQYETGGFNASSFFIRYGAYCQGCTTWFASANNYTTGFSIQGYAVPAPGTLALLSIGLLALGLSRRRKAH